MARTRSAKGAAATGKTASKDKATTTSSSTSLYTLPDPPANPPKLFVIPKSATPGARIITLQNPRYSKPTRYLVCPSTGFYEFTKITTPSPSSNPRSWLLSPSSPEPSSTTIESPDLFLATLFDPLFLLLPALSTPGKRMFLSPDDHLDALPNPDRHLSQILTWEPTRKLVEQRMSVICDTVEAGDENMYRLNEKKLLAEIVSKAKKMSENLPKSMDEKFVRKALEAPVMAVKSAQAGSSESETAESEQSKGDTPASLKSQESVSTTTTTTSISASDSQVSVASTTITEPDVEIISSAMVASPQILNLQRLRVAFNFICSSYIPPSISSALKEAFSSACDKIDFKPLDEYLEKLAKLRQEAAASRSNDFAGKRGRDEEDDERAEKKRKMEAEEKVKKANQSRGVKKLAKVNTMGMKKMSDFFKKK
ncbi:ribonuclease H2, subunit B [Cladorrhinum sp. PSN259]|nr:ribonuclease H2, subunit B [Cladorrhinum sp. PSN259]